jgi:hypothetical protein
MPIQDTVGTYANRMPAAHAGMVAELNGNRDIASRKIETAAVAFGLAVGRGTADGSAKLAGAGFEGVTIADKSHTADSYAVGEVAAVIRKGTVWVTAGAAVTPADTVYFAAATGVISNISAGGTAITGAKFETTAASGALVRLLLA